MRPIFSLGLLIWVAGTVIIRVEGHYLLRPAHTLQTILLYIVSLVAMLFLVQGIGAWLKIEQRDWIRVAGWLALPTLLLDPLSCIFFNRMFPDVDPAAAGIFGGWMLVSCCGAMLGGLLIRGATSAQQANAAGGRLSTEK